MCGRFTIDLPAELIAEIFHLEGGSEHSPRFNVAPAQLVPVIRRSADDKNYLSFLQWGLVPAWAKDPSIGSKTINARCETVHEKPAFRQAIKHRRCIVPASGFYEWQKLGTMRQPLHIHPQGNGIMAFAGIWESWKGSDGNQLETFTILTTNANDLIRPIHDRMPVILHPSEYDQWLGRHLDPIRLAHFYQPYPTDLLEMHPVSRLVNSVVNDSPDCILPLVEQ